MVKIHQDIHCPCCGKVIYKEGVETEETGQNCPNYCGWIELKMQGEDLAVLVCPTTY